MVKDRCDNAQALHGVAIKPYAWMTKNRLDQFVISFEVDKEENAKVNHSSHEEQRTSRNDEIATIHTRTQSNGTKGIEQPSISGGEKTFFNHELVETPTEKGKLKMDKF